MSLTIDLGPLLEHAPRRIVLEPTVTHEEFWDFVQMNPDVDVERTAEGKLIFHSPTGGGAGHSNGALTRYLDEWSEASGAGPAFDSSTMFHLPDGSDMSPDGAWIRQERWDALTEEEQEGFVPLCPDFVLELMSRTDRLGEAQAKMDDWMRNGVRLGWLIDRKSRRVYVYRPGVAPVALEDPAEVSGEPEMPGFILRTSRIF